MRGRRDIAAAELRGDVLQVAFAGGPIVELPIAAIWPGTRSVRLAGRGRLILDRGFVRGSRETGTCPLSAADVAACAAYYEGVVNGAESRRAVGQRLRAVREKFGWTSKRAAAELGTSVSALSRLESGRHRPTLRTIMHVAWAYAVPPASLLPPAPPQKRT